jgi:hypothetical protein
LVALPNIGDWSNAYTVSIKKSLPLNFRHLSLEGAAPLIEYVDANSDFPHPLIELTKKAKGRMGSRAKGEGRVRETEVGAAIM